MTDVTITRHDNGSRGEYHARIAGSDHIGRLTWVAHRDVQGREVRVADHTLVPPAIGGRGIAAMLVEALVEDARAQGFKISPLCSYVVAKFEDHPDWADVQA